MKKLSNTYPELKKSVADKKKRVLGSKFVGHLFISSKSWTKYDVMEWFLNCVKMASKVRWLTYYWTYLEKEQKDLSEMANAGFELEFSGVSRGSIFVVSYIY